MNKRNGKSILCSGIMLTGMLTGIRLLEKRKIGEYIEKNAARQQKQVESFHKGGCRVTAFRDSRHVL